MSATSLSNPQSFNLYVYCTNDPINFIDPSGLLAYLPAVVIGAEAGGPVGVIAVLVVVAVITALGLIFRGRAKDQTRIVGQVSQRFAPNETGSNGAWKQPAILAGVGAVNAFTEGGMPSRQALLGKITPLQAAINRARKALNNKDKDCKKLIQGIAGGDPSVLLDTLERNNQIVEERLNGQRGVTRSNNDPNRPYGGQGQGRNAKIVINSDILTNASMGKNHDVANNQDIDTAITVLHELGHATGANPYTHTGKFGGKDVSSATDVNRMIYDKCFKKQ